MTAARLELKKRGGACSSSDLSYWLGSPSESPLTGKLSANRHSSTIALLFCCLPSLRAISEPFANYGGVDRFIFLILFILVLVPESVRAAPSTPDAAPPSAHPGCGKVHGPIVRPLAVIHSLPSAVAVHLPQTALPTLLLMAASVITRFTTSHPHLPPCSTFCFSSPLAASWIASTLFSTTCLGAFTDTHLATDSPSAASPPYDDNPW